MVRKLATLTTLGPGNTTVRYQAGGAERLRVSLALSNAVSHNITVFGQSGVFLAAIASNIVITGPAPLIFDFGPGAWPLYDLILVVVTGAGMAGTILAELWSE